MFDKFICKDGASLYYLRSGEGAGGFLNPPEHAEHDYAIVEKRGGHECGYISLSYSLTESWIPEKVKSVARDVLNRYPGVITEEWICQVYRHFKHCYADTLGNNATNEKTYGEFWDNTEQEKDENPERHLGYLFVKQFDPTHTPRTDLF